MRRRAAALLLAAALGGCGLGGVDVPKGPPDARQCTDEARPDGSCLPPSRATIQDWLDAGVPREAVQDCLRRHPDGDQALAACIWGYVVAP